ncbi:BTB/POZ domain-containing protein, partial [Toxoplasma gondii p89]
MMHSQAGVVVSSGLDNSSLLSSRQAKQGNPLARLRTFQQSIHRLLTDPAFESLFDVVIVAENK